MSDTSVISGAGSRLECVRDPKSCSQSTAGCPTVGGSSPGVDPTASSSDMTKPTEAVQLFLPARASPSQVSLLSAENSQRVDSVVMETRATIYKKLTSFTELTEIHSYEQLPEPTCVSVVAAV